MDGEWNFKILKHQCGNGPVYVFPDQAISTVDSSEEAEDDNEDFPVVNFTKTWLDTTENLSPIPSLNVNLKPQGVSKESISVAKVVCQVCQAKVPSNEIEKHADMCADKATSSNSYAHLVQDISDDILLDEMEETDVMGKDFFDQIKFFQI